MEKMIAGGTEHPTEPERGVRLRKRNNEILFEKPTKHSLVVPETMDCNTTIKGNDLWVNPCGLTL